MFIQYMYLFTQGRGWGGRVEPERRLEEGQQTVHKDRKYQHNGPYINSDKHLLLSPFTGKFFLDDDTSISENASKLKKTANLGLILTLGLDF